MIALVTCALFLLAVANRTVSRSFLYPPALFAGVWAMYLLLLLLSGRIFFQIGDDTLFFYFWGALIFSAGGLLASFLWSLKRKRERVTCVPLSVHQREKVHRALDALLVLLILGLPLYWYHLLQLAAQSKVADLWVAIRTQTIEAGEGEAARGFRLLDNLVVLSLITVLVTYYEDDGARTRRIRTYVAVSLALTYTFLTAVQSGAVLIILSLIALNWIKRGRVSRKVFIAASLVFVLTFSALAILLQKGDTRKDDTLSENIPTIVDGFLWYAVGGIVAFDTILHEPNRIPRAQTIDRQLLLAANKFGMHFDVSPQHADYVPIGPGKDMNIYTFYFSYVPDFGVVGATVLVFLLGAALTWVYQTCHSRSPVAVILYSIVFTGIVLSGFAEFFFLNLNFMTKAFLFTWILYRWAKRGHPDYALQATGPASC